MHATTQDQSIVQKAYRIVAAHREHLKARKVTELGTQRYCDLPFAPWEVKWAIMTLCMFEFNGKPEAPRIFGEFSGWWGDLDRYKSDADLTALNSARVAPEGSPERLKADQVPMDLFSRVFAGQSEFYALLAQINGKESNKALDQMESNLTKVVGG